MKMKKKTNCALADDGMLLLPLKVLKKIIGAMRRIEKVFFFELFCTCYNLRRQLVRFLDDGVGLDRFPPQDHLVHVILVLHDNYPVLYRRRQLATVLL